MLTCLADECDTVWTILPLLVIGIGLLILITVIFPYLFPDFKEDDTE